jgi:hypothetical protein
MVEEIRNKDTVFAIIIRSYYKRDGIEFFTPNQFSQQLAYMNRPKGYSVDAHSHRKVERKVTLTQEVLHMRSGKVKITIFDNNHDFLKECIVETGDTILLANGGHALEMLEDSELIEIKQGPYGGDDDKVRFTVAKTNNEQKTRL